MDRARAFLKFFVVAPLAIAIILFAIANRTPVTVSLDPFNREAPAFALSLPLYLIVLIAIGLGVVAGGIGAWLAQGRHRKAERAWRREAQTARADVDRMKASLAALPASRS